MSDEIRGSLGTSQDASLGATLSDEEIGIDLADDELEADKGRDALGDDELDLDGDDLDSETKPGKSTKKPFVVKNMAGVPDGVVTPEFENALKHNNPDVYAELLVRKREYYDLPTLRETTVSPEPVIIVDRFPEGTSEVVVKPTVIIIPTKDEKKLAEDANVANPKSEEKVDNGASANARTGSKSARSENERGANSRTAAAAPAKSPTTKGRSTSTAANKSKGR